MAQVNTLSATNSVAERALAIVANLKEAVRRRSVYKRTLRELNALTDREMADLGLHRSMIADVAREAAYGK